jgi:hypothetical protein
LQVTLQSSVSTVKIRAQAELILSFHLQNERK